MSLTTSKDYELIIPYLLEEMPEREIEVDGRKVTLSRGWRLMRREKANA